MPVVSATLGVKVRNDLNQEFETSYNTARSHLKQNNNNNKTKFKSWYRMVV